jgi:hypothetical protein
MSKSRTAEYNFVLKIDCTFPYNNEAAGYALVDEALQISDEAVYSVMNELARIPHSDRNDLDTTHVAKLLQYLLGKFQHPLAPMLGEVALLMVHSKELPVADAIGKMEMLRPHKGMYAALSILYDSCDDADGKVEDLFETIVGQWAV